MGATTKERAALLAKAKLAEAMAAQFGQDSHFRDTWLNIAEGYRNLAGEAGKPGESRRPKP